MSSEQKASVEDLSPIRTAVGDKMIWKDWVEEEKVFFHGTVIEIKSSMEARKAGWIKTGKKTGIVLLLEVHETGKQVVKRRANVFRDRDA